MQKDDFVKNKLKELLAVTGADMANLSRKIGRNQTYIQQYTKKGIPKKLDRDLRDKIAITLGFPTSVFDENSPSQPAVIIPKESTSNNSFQTRVPVYGYAAGLIVLLLAGLFLAASYNVESKGSCAQYTRAFRFYLRSSRVRSPSGNHI